MKIALVVLYILWGIWVTCASYQGFPTDERWEWGIGTSNKIDGTGTYDE